MLEQDRQNVQQATERKKVGQLLQTNSAAACVSFGKNISAKSVHMAPSKLLDNYFFISIQFSMEMALAKLPT